MDLESVKRYLEKGGGDVEDEKKQGSIIDGLPLRYFERFIMEGLHVDLIEPGRVVCSMKVPSRLLNGGNFLHGGATATLVDLEEIEIEAKTLRVGKAVGVVSVEIRKKKTGKIVAQGRHTKYLAIASKM